MNKNKVIFCGTPNISVEILKGLLNVNEIEVVGVITQPDKPVGRKKILQASPVKEMALSLNLPVIQPLKMSEGFEEIKALDADFLVTCAYGQFVPNKILELFKNCINVHASLLPKYRGGSPVQFAIMNGETQTGITLMQMVKKMDAGVMYKKGTVSIDPEDDNGIVFDKLSVLGKEMIEKYIVDIFNEKIIGEEQDESEVTFAYNLSNEEEEIDWNKSAIDIHNFIRALNPRPVAYTFLNGKERIKIARTRLIREDEHFAMVMKMFRNGEVVTTDKEGVIVWTDTGMIKILELQREGKKMQLANNFIGKDSPIQLGSMFSAKQI